ncbi:MAG: cupin domain-containing protein [Thiotrichales bacterium]|nr:MAG: cupin domain-containing protein [Thiotrichales bacterium]
MPTNRQKISDSPCHPPFPGELTAETFLQEYWQKKPLLVRNAFPDIRSPLTADELAGLACDEDTNARIVFEQHEQGHWHVIHGPLNEDDFSDLPDKNWTLLVTDVEKHVPEARQLIDRFRFIPDWRIDDLMVSYAPEGGSVGPHTDAYDVFLIQTQGQRRWMINSEFDDACIEGTELRILERFTAAEDWILEPGDMLYLPPNIAHHGVALNECMTCSVGFRAPSYAGLVSEFAETIAADLDAESRYQDPDLVCQVSPAEISRRALGTIKSRIAERLTIEDDRFVRWFGEYSSEPRAGIHPFPPERTLSTYPELTASLTADKFITQSPASRFLFVDQDDSALLFVDGRSYVTSQAFARSVADNRSIRAQQLIEAVRTDHDRHTLLELYNTGCLLIA